MFHVETVRIAARPEAVWAVLVDVQGWRKWTASVELVRRLDQAGEFGVRSQVWVKQPSLLGAVWRVTGFEPERSFVWESRSPGVLTVAGHRLEARDDGTLVTLELRQSGPLAPVAGLFFGRLTRRYLAMEAAGLKAYCEAVR